MPSLCLPAGQREPLWSHFSRLAALNGVPTEIFAEDLGVSFVDVIAGKPAVFDRLGARLEAELPPVRDWTPMNLGGPRVLWRGHVFPFSKLWGGEIRGCPACLREDAAQSDLPPHVAMQVRAEWLHGLCFVCLRHGALLVPLWQDSNRRKRLDSPERFKPIADSVLSGRLVAAPAIPSAFDRWFFARLAGTTSETWLDRFDLSAALEFCDLLGRTLFRDRHPRLADMPRRVRWQAMGQAFTIASAGERAIRALLTSWQQTQSSSPDGPQRRFGVLYTNLARYRHGPEFAPFRALLRNYILDTWPLPAGADVLGEPLPERRFHSVLTAAQEAQVAPSRMRAILSAHAIIPPARTGRGDAWDLFAAKPNKDLIELVARGISGKELCAKFGMSPAQLSTLRHSGLFQPALDGVGHQPIWDPDEVAAFIASLAARARPLKRRLKGWDGIGAVALRLRVPPGDILKRLLEDEACAIGVLPNRFGYSALQVRIVDLADIQPQLPPGTLNIQEFARVVGLRWPDARRLVHEGHTPSTSLRNPASGARQPYLTPEDVAAFHRRFATHKTLAQELQQSWQRMAARLRALGTDRFQKDGTSFGPLYLRDSIGL